MPKLTTEEIISKIRKGEIAAVSIDTAVFDRYDYNFYNLTLAKFDQFWKGGVKFILSEIIVKELRAHVLNKITDAQKNLKSAVTKFSKAYGADRSVDDLMVTLGFDAANLAKKKVDDYLTSIKAEVAHVNDNSNLAKDVIEYYFDCKAPFEENKNKKYEFPDAFALLSLEEVSNKLNTLILCVSPDKGWQNFGNASSRLIVESDVNLVLSWFNDQGSFVANNILTMWQEGKAQHLLETVEKAFDYYLDGLQYTLEADVPLNFEAEPHDAILQYLCVNKIENTTVIAEDEEFVTFMVKVEAKIRFEAEFYFSTFDSIDRDSVNLGSEIVATESDLIFEVVISVGRDYENSDFEDVEVNITSRKLMVDFGYVEPFPDEDPTFEKY